MCVTTVTLGTAPSKMRTPTNYVSSSGGSSGGAIWIEFTLPDDCGGLDVTGFKVLAEENELKGLPFQVAEISPNLKGIQDSTGSCKLGSSNDSPVQNYKFTTIPTSSGRNASIKANTLYTVYVDVSNTQGDSYERSDGLEILTAGKTGPAPPVLDCVVNRRHGATSPSKCLLPLTKKTGGTMQLSWSPPEDTGGGIIIGYQLQLCPVTEDTSCAPTSSDWYTPFKYPTEDAWMSNELFSVNDPLLGAPKQDFEVKRLLSGHWYHVRLRAKNDGGSGGSGLVSGWSDVKQYLTPSMTLPAKISSKDITMTAQTGGTMTISWIPPGDTGGSKLDEVRIKNYFLIFVFCARGKKFLLLCLTFIFFVLFFETSAEHGALYFYFFFLSFP